MRAIYAGRRARLIDVLARHAPGIRLTGLAAGFHALAHLPAAADEQAVVAAARERRGGLYGVGKVRAAPAGGAPPLLPGFGEVAERAIEPGIAAVADLLNCPTHGRPGGRGGACGRQVSTVAGGPLSPWNWAHAGPQPVWGSVIFPMSSSTNAISAASSDSRY